MSFITELDSVASAISTEFSGSAVKYDIPKEPKTNTLVIRAQNNDLETESRFMFKIERDYQIVYFTDDPGDALDKMDKLARKCMNRDAMIPLTDGSLRYIRINSFGFGIPVQTESGLFSIVGVMPTELRQARDQETYQKIMQINTRLIIGV